MRRDEVCDKNAPEGAIVAVVLASYIVSLRRVLTV